VTIKISTCGTVSDKVTSLGRSSGLGEAQGTSK